MRAPHLGEWTFISLALVVFASVYCVGASLDCQPRVCARCQMIIGLLDYVKDTGQKISDKVNL